MRAWLLTAMLIGCTTPPCPDGAVLTGQAPPAGTEQWCQKEDASKNFLKHGKYTSWHKNGQKNEEGEYRENLKEGSWFGWYENGQKRAELKFSQGKEDGPQLTWYQNGQKSSEGSMKGGKFQGKWTSWYDNSKKKSEGEFKDGIKDGPWELWYDNGTYKEKCTWSLDVPNGLCERWSERGTQIEKCNWSNGVRDGECETRNERGKLREKGTYKADKKTVEWIESRDELFGGEDKGSYVDGKRTGSWVFSAGSTKRHVIFAEDGRGIKGRYEEYDKEGRKQQEIDFVECSYFDPGEVGLPKSCKEDGFDTKYDAETGKIRTQSKTVNGELDFIKCYYPSGKVAGNYDFSDCLLSWRKK
jgi:antitoxin component YwqK of YwqJK toxin-antitoxin module